MYLAARRSNAGGNRISAGLPACSGAAPAVICPNPDSVLGVGGDDVPEVIGRLVRRPHLHCLCQGRDGDPHERQRQRNGPWRLHQVGAGPFAGDLEQHPPRHVLDDLVVEIGAGGCLGDPQEGCYCTDLPGDQLTGTLPIKVHAGRSEVLQEHVDLAVEPRTSRHVASLPSSRHRARLLRTAGGGNPVVLSPLSPLAVLLLLKPRVVRRAGVVVISGGHELGVRQDAPLIRAACGVGDGCRGVEPQLILEQKSSNRWQRSGV